MNAEKKLLVDTIRSNTAYPAYRAVIGVISIILMILAAFEALLAIIGGFAAGSQANSPLAGFFVFLVIAVSAVLTFFFAKLWNEGAQILVDIGDSTLDANPSLRYMAGSIAPTVTAPITPPLSMPTTAPPTY